MRSLYMHTLDGKPAQFDGWQICYAMHVIKRFANDLDQIREEQLASRRWRAKKGYDNNSKQDHRVIHIPDETALEGRE